MPWHHLGSRGPLLGAITRVVASGATSGRDPGRQAVTPLVPDYAASGASHIHMHIYTSKNRFGGLSIASWSKTSGVHAAKP